MKFASIAFTLMMFGTVGALEASPVLYSFGLSNSDGNIISFQYTAPGYISTNSGSLSAAQLTGLEVRPSYSLVSTVLIQDDFITHTGVTNTTTFHPSDNSGDFTIDSQLSRGPGQPSVYLDRDGSYTLNINFIPHFGGAGTATLSVTQTPEPATLPLMALSLAVVAGFLYRQRSARRFR